MLVDKREVRMQSSFLMEPLVDGCSQPGVHVLTPARRHRSCSV